MGVPRERQTPVQPRSGLGALNSILISVGNTVRRPACASPGERRPCPLSARGCYLELDQT